ncbi:MAG: DUF4105 domain-containing protein [Bradymonadia bacterium]
MRSLHGVLGIVGLILCCPIYPKSTQAKPPPSVDVVIVGPGDSFHSSFGHTAVVVTTGSGDGEETQVVYNFGVTKLGNPWFLYDFMMGQSVYWGHRRAYSKQLKKWVRADRDVRRYRLNASPEKVGILIDQLNEMVLKDRRNFTYDLFRENCVTKVRDVLDKTLGGIIRDNWSGRLANESFRARSEHGYAKHPLLYFAFQWFLGQGMDHKPDLLLKSGDPMVFGGLIEQLSERDGKKIFGEPIIDNLRVGPPPIGGTVYWYPVLMACLCILGFVPLLAPGRMSRWTYATLLILSGFIFSMLAALLMYLHLNSQWWEMTGNTLMLLVWPTDIILVWAGIKYGTSGHILGWLKIYLTTHLAASVILLTLGFLIDSLTGPTWPRVVFFSTWLAMISYLRFRGTQSERTTSETVQTT